MPRCPQRAVFSRRLWQKCRCISLRSARNMPTLLRCRSYCHSAITAMVVITTTTKATNSQPMVSISPLRCGLLGSCRSAQLTAQVPTRAFGKAASARNRPTLTCYNAPAAIKPKLNLFKKLPCAFAVRHIHILSTWDGSWALPKKHTQPDAYKRALIVKAVDKKTGPVDDTDLI